MNLDWNAKFKSVVQELAKVGELYAEARGVSYQAQELKSSVLSSIMLQFVKEGKPVSQAEISAKASEDYKQHIKETAEAIKKELRLKALYEVQRARLEAYRSLCSLEKSTRDHIE